MKKAEVSIVLVNDLNYIKTYDINNNNNACVYLKISKVSFNVLLTRNSFKEFTSYNKCVSTESKQKDGQKHMINMRYKDKFQVLICSKYTYASMSN